MSGSGRGAFGVLIHTQMIKLVGQHENILRCAKGSDVSVEAEPSSAQHAACAAPPGSAVAHIRMAGAWDVALCYTHRSLDTAPMASSQTSRTLGQRGYAISPVLPTSFPLMSEGSFAKAPVSTSGRYPKFL